MIDYLVGKKKEVNSLKSPNGIIPMSDPWDWYLCLHLPLKTTIHVGKYTSPMDPMGYFTNMDFSEIRGFGTLPKSYLSGRVTSLLFYYLTRIQKNPPKRQLRFKHNDVKQSTKLQISFVFVWF